MEEAVFIWKNCTLVQLQCLKSKSRITTLYYISGKTDLANKKEVTYLKGRINRSDGICLIRFKSLTIRILALFIIIGLCFSPYRAFVSSEGDIATLITGNGYSFDSASGMLTISTDSGTANWRSDPGIAKTDVITVVVHSGVLNISDNAFNACTALTAATLPSGLTLIGEYSFYNCSSLQTVNIPYGVTRLKYGAFRRCGALTAVTVPSSVSKIDAMAFYMCPKLLSATFQRTAAPAFGANVFSKYAGFKINYPLGGAGYTSLGYTAEGVSMALDIVTGNGYTFNPNTDTLTVSSDSGTTNWKSDSNFNKSVVKTVVIGDGVQNILDSAFSECTVLSSVTLPAGLSVIKDYAFNGCTSLGAITIPNGVSRLRYSAFTGCTSLTTVILPSTVATIERRVFFGCSKLINATFMGITAPTVGSSAFGNCAEDFKIYYPISGTGYTGLGYTAEAIDVTLSTEGYSFDSTSGTLTIASNDGTTNWRNSSIAKDAVKTGIIQSGVTLILDNTFKDCISLTSISVPDGVTHIGKYAFDGCHSLTGIVLPGSLTSIGDEAFFNCVKLAAISIPDGVTTIGCEALANTGISSMTIPNSVLLMGQGAFCYCSKLTSVTFEAGCQLTNIPIIAFSDSGLASIDIPDSITSIESSAFDGCALSSVTIPSQVASIKNSAFKNCSKLYAASFEGIAAPILGTNVFDNCHTSFKIYYSVGGTGYGSLDYPAVTDKAPVMGDGYYFDTESGTLTISSDSGMANWRSSTIVKSSVLSIIIESGASNIADEAFEGCASLNTILIPENVTSIGSRAFEGCSSLLTVTISNNVDSIGSYAFRYCTSLATVTIPAKVISIGAGAFYGCGQLNSAIFNPIAAPSLETGAFNGCHAGFKIYYPAKGTGYETLGYSAEAIGVYTMDVINGTGSGKYEVDARVSIKADAAPDGKVFNRWITNNGGAFTDAASAVTTFTMPAAKVTVTATFRDEMQFTITAKAISGGTVNPAGTVSVAEGHDETFVITPNTGYRIESITVDGISQGVVPAYIFTKVTANHAIMATFTKIENNGNGSDDGNGNNNGNLSSSSETSPTPIPEVNSNILSPSPSEISPTPVPETNSNILSPSPSEISPTPASEAISNILSPAIPSDRKAGVVTTLPWIICALLIAASAVAATVILIKRRKTLQ